MAANDRPSASTSPSPPPGPSSSTSGDQPDGQSRESRKRKADETDMPEDTKRSRVTSDDDDDETAEGCPYYNMESLVARGQYREALAYTERNRDISWVKSKAKLQRFLQRTMIFLIIDKRLSCEVLGVDYADVMMYLLSERLEDYNVADDNDYCEFFGAFLKPDYTETLLELINKHATSLKDKRRMLRIMFLNAEHSIVDDLRLIRNFTRADMPDDLQECQKELAFLVQMLPATLHDDSDPAMSLSWLSTTAIGDCVPMFAKAVELQLVQEAKLLYDAGAVNNAELMAVANKPDIQKMLSDEEDQSKMAVFLRKVLKQPRSLGSMAMLQVSRLVGQDVLGREDRVRQLPLPSTLHDALLRPQVNRCRKEIECNDQGTDGRV